VDAYILYRKVINKFYIFNNYYEIFEYIS